MLSDIEDVTQEGSGQGSSNALNINIARSIPMRLKSQKVSEIYLNV